MSGDVTAAIERLATLAGQLVDLEWHQFSDDVLAVLAEVERLRAKNELLDTGLLAQQRDTVVAQAEVERLRAEPDNEAVSRTVQMLRDENAKLRAERDEIAERADREAAELTVALRDVRDLRAELEALAIRWRTLRGAQVDMLNGRPDFDALEEIALVSREIDDLLKADQ